MYVSIRRYKTKQREEVLELVKNDFLPLLSRGPGFVSYDLVETAPGEFTAISFFQSEEWANKSNEMALAWVAKNLQPLLTGDLLTAAGEVVIEKKK